MGTDLFTISYSNYNALGQAGTLTNKDEKGTDLFN